MQGSGMTLFLASGHFGRRIRKDRSGFRCLVSFTARWQRCGGESEYGLLRGRVVW
ncbi:hypothetical protein IG631_08446 [Alternaria alternata]|nr:hypothetical protein IG631_08446 [Alternaria alternata]